MSAYSRLNKYVQFIADCTILENANKLLSSLWKNVNNREKFVTGD